MPQEIERKFILSKIPEHLPTLKIKQGYLQLDKKCTIRVRSSISSNGINDTLTIKGPSNSSGMSRYEFETKISNEDSINLFKICHKPIIEKTRHIYIYKNMKWELDEFHEENQGLLIGEIELERENMKFDIPDIVKEEVTGQSKYYNSMLQKRPYKTWQ